VQIAGKQIAGKQIAGKQIAGKRSGTEWRKCWLATQRQSNRKGAIAGNETAMDEDWEQQQTNGARDERRAVEQQTNGLKLWMEIWSTAWTAK
jgi:hypothetical protein